MLITNEFEVAEQVDEVWRFFDDVPAVAACLPGAELTRDLGDDRRSGAANSLRHFLGTPAAMHIMRAPGTGVPPSRFRPPVYVTIWS